MRDLPSSSRAKPFSLLARPSKPPDPEPAILDTEEAIVDEGEEVGNETVGPAASEDERGRSTVRSKEDRLRQDLFVLRKLNEGFALYKNALSDTKSSTESVAEQLKQTNALLNKYIDILAKSESATRMIFDERWHGADDDEATLDRLQQEAAEKARREAEERAEAERKEKERLEREERERLLKEEKDRAEAEKRERLAIRAGYGSVRGVRGTRASARARGAAIARTHGAPAPTSTSTTRSKTSSVPTAGGSGGRIPRPTYSASSSSRTTSSTTRSGNR
ncbi:hypothetical protein PNOK_0586700 [Pyrrhoderma noxium]|uniref:DASH complex subunit DUO1 n=1 Tax=Pyrrhoderma noxium TaxID=2282107 RepID=A0A286UHF3_9AGAM|nr:hypothetical protein PNOK_0586700 [Pyrrhoderma noxium]